MKRILLAVTALAAIALSGVVAKADVIDDPLHGVCLVGCAANGVNISISNPPLNFGFEASPTNTGGLTMDFLVPTADGLIPSGHVSVTGSMNGALSFTANLFSSTPWTAGQLDTYLGIVASPTNVLDAIQHSSGGFFVYQGFAGNYTLPQQGTVLPDSVPLWSIAGGLPDNTAIFAFLHLADGSNVATANSSALQVPGPIVGAGLPGLIAALIGMVGLNRWRKRRVA